MSRNGRTPPPARPTTDADLGFTPRPATRWLQPRTLAPAAVTTVLATLFGQFTDRREAQGVLDAGEVEDRSDAEVCWVDHVSDSGDGFDAGYAVARAASAPHLDVGGARLPRGDVLVLGGDQVYPTASIADYRDRLLGPWRAALPWVPDGPDDPPVPSAYALPGNHDWYDGLTSFLRLFGQQAWLGGRRLRQTRSYFAVALPGRWWLLGVDTQLGGWLDRPQLDWFASEVVPRLRPGDGIVLCVPQPSWVKEGGREALESLAHLRNHLLEPTGARIRLVLTGDKHHYARYADTEGRQLVTAGGGGAYLSATHHLPGSVEVPAFGASSTFGLARAYPDQATSARLGRGVLVEMIRRNPGQVAAFAGLHLLAARRVRAGQRPVAPGWKAALVAGLGAFGGSSKPGRAFGGLHGLAQVATLGATSRVGAGGPVRGAVAAAAGGALSAELLAAYLWAEDRLVGARTNELFAARALETHKHFLRLEVRASGDLVVHPVAVDRPAGWRLESEGGPSDPWLAPDGPSAAPRSVEDPFTVQRS